MFKERGKITWLNSEVGSVSHLPEQAQELTQGELKGNQELCFVQQGESLFTDVTLNNHLNTKTHPGSEVTATCTTIHEYQSKKKQQLTGNLLGNLDLMLHTSSFLVSGKKWHTLFNTCETSLG